MSLFVSSPGKRRKPLDTLHTTFCFAAQRSSSKAVHGQTSDNHRQSVFSWSAAGQGVSHTATGVRRSSTVGLRVSGPGRRQGTARHTAHTLFCSPSSGGQVRTDVRRVRRPTTGPTHSQPRPGEQPETQETAGDPEPLGAGATRSRRPGEHSETRRPQVRGATLHVYWTRSTQLGSADGETTGQQRQSTVAGRTLQ